MLRIYNSLTNKIEVFKPIHEGKVSIYVCGPTVYNFIHIGNARPLVFFDTLRRYFILKGYDVTFISNFTDIDDKIINRAIEENTSETDVASKYIDAYLADARSLNCLDVDIRCKVTDFIPQIVEFVEDLVAKGFAYKSGSDVYFRVGKVNEYGMLSNQVLSELIAGSRVEQNTLKESQADFTLWKETAKGISYPSSFGEGRPGWHTECVVMIKSLVDKMVDIHAGGHDLTFPHHENEMAQSLAFDNTKLANYWIHNGMLNLDNDKMSKSLGNVILAKDIISEYGGNVIRIALLQTSYRQTINFTKSVLEASEAINEKIITIYKALHLNKQLFDVAEMEDNQRLFDAFENDLNAPNVFTLLFDVIKQVNAEIRNGNNGLQYFELFNSIIYLLGLDYTYPELTDEDKNRYNNWLEARKNKDFEKADELREMLVNKGII